MARTKHSDNKRSNRSKSKGTPTADPKVLPNSVDNPIVHADMSDRNETPSPSSINPSLESPDLCSKSSTHVSEKSTKPPTSFQLSCLKKIGSTSKKSNSCRPSSNKNLSNLMMKSGLTHEPSKSSSVASLTPNPLEFSAATTKSVLGMGSTQNQASTKFWESQNIQGMY